MRRTERLLAIVLLLQTRGRVTAERLAEALGVCVRTIYRDMDALSLAHVPVSMEYGPGGGYFIANEYRMEAGAFTAGEAVALAAGAAMAGASRLFDDTALRQALVKLEAVAPSGIRDEVREAGERVMIDLGSWHRSPGGSPFLETVRIALSSRKRIDLCYRRADRSTAQWRCVEPHGLVCKAGVWYLVAFCLERVDFRIFRLDRIDELAVLDERFVTRPEFNLRAYWERSRDSFERQTMPIHLLLRISPVAVRWLTAAHTTVREETNGALIISMGVDSLEAAVAQSLALGSDAEVIEPAEVREAVISAAQEVVANYA